MATTPTRPSNGWGTIGGGGMTPSYYDAVLGENLYPSLFFYQFGAVRKVPRNFGLTIKIPRSKRRNSIVYNVSSANYGTAITGTYMCSQVVSGTLQQFAGAYANSDIALMTSIGDPNELAIRDLARDLAFEMDRYCQDNLSANTNGYQVRAAGTASGSLLNESAIKISDITKMVARLQSYNNPRWPDGKYPLILHATALHDIFATLSSGYHGSWVDVNKYTDDNVSKIYQGEAGTLYGARIITTTALPRPVSAGGFSQNQSGYVGFMFAPEAYYIVEHDDQTPRTIVKPLGSGGTADPANMLSTVAAKVFFTCFRGFQDTSSSPVEYRMIRFPHGSTINNE